MDTSTLDTDVNEEPSIFFSFNPTSRSTLPPILPSVKFWNNKSSRKKTGRKVMQSITWPLTVSEFGRDLAMPSSTDYPDVFDNLSTWMAQPGNAMEFRKLIDKSSPDSSAKFPHYKSEALLMSALPGHSVCLDGVYYGDYLPEQPVPKHPGLASKNGVHPPDSLEESKSSSLTEEKEVRR